MQNLMYTMQLSEAEARENWEYKRSYDDWEKNGKLRLSPTVVSNPSKICYNKKYDEYNSSETYEKIVPGDKNESSYFSRRRGYANQ